MLSTFSLVLLAVVVPFSQAANDVSSFATSLSTQSGLVPQPPLSWANAAPIQGNTVLTISSKGPPLIPTILGFGSALTESAAFNFASLTNASRSALVSALWSPPPVGNGYTLGRMHLGSADFSLSTYSLAETSDDFNLTHFDDALTHDSRYILPLAREAHAAAAATGASPLKLFFSPWSPPAWLKRNGAMVNSTVPEGLLNGTGPMTTLANYFTRFTAALFAAGVPVWGATLQNEPLMTFPTGAHVVYESCAWSAASQAEFLGVVGAAVAAHPNTDVRALQLWAYDWNRDRITDWAATLLASPARKFLSGIAHHWYAWRGSLFTANLEKVAALPGAPPLLGTEACLIKKGVADDGVLPSIVPWGVFLTSGRTVPGGDSVALPWAAGELYLLDILATLNAGSAGWVDWNACLDFHGGPNHVNRSDISAPVLVDVASDSVYLQAPYFAMAHVSRFVPVGAVRVGCDGTGISPGSDAVTKYISPQIDGKPPPKGSVPVVAACFLAKDGATVSVVVLNANKDAVGFTLTDGSLGSVNTVLEAHSMRTFQYSV